MNHDQLLARENGAEPATGFEYGGRRENNGMTKRELFAVMLMQGLMSSDVEGNLTEEACARIGVGHADALLVELQRSNP